jgi:hypothetical protein
MRTKLCALMIVKRFLQTSAWHLRIHPTDHLYQFVKESRQWRLFALWPILDLDPAEQSPAEFFHLLRPKYSQTI